MRPPKKRKPDKRYTTLASRAAGPLGLSISECRSWPIVACFVPDMNVWKATGIGAAGLVRQKPDGDFASAFFNLKLSDGGIGIMYGKSNEKTLEPATSLVRSMEGLWPVPIPGTPELASKLIWGVYAWGQERGVDFPKEQRLPYTSLIAQPPGSSHWWQQQLTAEDLTPPGLVRASSMLYHASCEQDIDEKMEFVCFSAITFDVGDIDALAASLRNAAPMFDEQVPGEFTITREYPKKHWSPLSRLGGRQVIASACVQNNQLIVECKSLSMLAYVIEQIEKAAPGQIEFHSGDWKTVEDITG